MRNSTLFSYSGAITALFLMSMASPLLADTINSNFSPVVSGGLERLEFRGNGNNTSWSIGLGDNTQQAGSFNQTGFDWADNVTYDFTYAVTAAGDATFSLFEEDGSTSLAALNWSGIDLGNTLQVHAKRDVDVTFAGQNANGDSSDPFGVDYTYVTIDPAIGFTLSGNITFRGPIGNQSTSGVTITAGNVPAVPIPAAAWLFGSALLGIAGVGYRRKRQA